nr:DUF2252 family protein [Achromobacter animicus]
MGNTARDPVDLLRSNSAGRVEALVPLRYGRTAVWRFRFFRGNAIIQAHALEGTVNSGIVFPVYCDTHLMNLGGFATPE